MTENILFVNMQTPSPKKKTKTKQYKNKQTNKQKQKSNINKCFRKYESIRCILSCVCLTLHFSPTFSYNICIYHINLTKRAFKNADSRENLL